MNIVLIPLYWTLILLMTKRILWHLQNQDDCLLCFEEESCSILIKWIFLSRNLRSRIKTSNWSGLELKFTLSFYLFLHWNDLIGQVQEMVVSEWISEDALQKWNVNLLPLIKIQDSFPRAITCSYCNTDIWNRFEYSELSNNYKFY